MNSLRKLIQRDVAGRGLNRIPGYSLFAAWPDDLVHAARSLAWHPKPHLVIVTGFPIPREDCVRGETDGPLGALFLARALRPLGIRVTVGAESFWKSDLPLTPALPTLPTDTTHLLSIERVGPSRHDGRCYSMRGRDVTEFVAPVAGWFEGQRPPGVVTMGIGDGGNEIGMGKISRDLIARNIEHGNLIACRVSVDHLIVAGVSNWGAYALATSILHLRNQPPPADLFDPLREAAELHRLVEQDHLIDGKTGRAEPTVDGLPLEEYLDILPRLRDWLESSRGRKHDTESSERGPV